MDQELQEVAALALRNAFWYDFSALVNAYLKTGEGLAVENQDYMLGDLTSVFGRDLKAKFDGSIDIWTQNGPNKLSTTSHDTILEALLYKHATEVHLQGKKVFERRSGEWYFVGMD